MNDGVSATFCGSDTVNFETHTGVVDSLNFDEVVAGVGQASISSIKVERAERTTVTDTVQDSFWVDIVGTNIINATFTLPSGEVKTMEADDDGTWYFEVRTTEPATDLADIIPGTYTISITGTDGNTRGYEVDLVAGDIPADTPALDQGTGFSTTDPRPELTWATPTDPDVDAIVFTIESWGNDFEDELSGELLLGYTPGADLDTGGYLTSLDFADIVAEGTIDGAEYTVSYVKGHDAYFNIVPEPPLLPGDANGDGCVNDLDLTALAVHWQEATDLWEHGDFDGNGIVDDLDLTALAVNWQQGCGGGGGSFADAWADGQASVPEPASALLLLLGFAGVTVRRMRK